MSCTEQSGSHMSKQQSSRKRVGSEGWSARPARHNAEAVKETSQREQERLYWVLDYCRQTAYHNMVRAMWSHAAGNGPPDPKLNWWWVLWWWFTHLGERT